MYQDRKGFIWIGTQDGLNRFDGFSFTTFSHDLDNSKSISSNYIKSIHEDDLGNLWIGTINGLNYLNTTTGQFTRYFHEPENPKSISDNNIKSINIDHLGNLWIGTQHGGLNQMNGTNSVFTHYQHSPKNPNSIGKGIVTVLFEDKDNNFWIGTSEGGLNLINQATRTFARFLPDDNDPHSINDKYIWTIYQDKEGNLWIGTSSGLSRLNIATGKFSNWKPAHQKGKAISDYKVEAIQEDAKNRLLITIDGGGLYQFDRTTETFLSLVKDNNVINLNEENFKQIYKDRTGKLWIGTWGKGLYSLDESGAVFTLIRQESGNLNGLSFNVITSFHEDKQGNIWIGTWGGGINLWNRITGQFSWYQHEDNHPNTIAHNEVLAIYEDRQGIFWFAMDGGGISRLDRSTGLFHHYKHDDNNPLSLSHDEVFVIFEDSNDHLWFGTREGGLNRLDRSTGNFYHYRHDPQNPFSISDDLILCIYEDSTGKLWIGTRSGLNCMDDIFGKFIRFHHDPNNPNSLSHNGVSCIHEDANGLLWIGTTGGGLNAFDPTSKQIARFSQKDGLANNVVYGIQEDDLGRLWMSTNKGLSCFDPKSKTFNNYTVSDGLQDYEFNTGAHYKSPTTGELFFGGINGFNLFQPNDIKPDTFVPPVVINSLTYYQDNKKVTDYFISNKEEIEIAFEENILVFEFASLCFRKTSKIHFKYQLEGFSDQWYDLGNKREVTFTGLAPDNYTLRVKGTNSDGVWNEVPTELKIIILPPWYQSHWAYSLYFLLGLSAISGIYYFLKRRWQLQTQLELEKQESIRLKELDAFKTRLYTNITHEFRTPLTVILGLVDQMMINFHDRAETKMKDSVEIVRRNGRNLLHLINQVLDLSRLEANKMELHQAHGDILNYVQYIVESFLSHAESKNIYLAFYSELPDLQMDYDPERILQIVSNLLSNAIKFTPPSGKVIVRLYKEIENGKPLLILNVKDTGSGIAKKDLPYIFDRFYQANSSTTRREAGTGIGLALTCELVNLMQGKIEVFSTLGEGTTFLVRLPISKEKESTTLVNFPDGVDEIVSVYNNPGNSLEKIPYTVSPINDPLPLALVVEDNLDVVKYIKECLEKDYRVLEANDGRRGIEQAIEKVPSIIISDVMMPGADGFELCETLKTDERTSHIPIILLTAKATVEDRIAGLEKGADAYLAKPFHKRELMVRLRKLIEGRIKLQEKYSHLQKDELVKGLIKDRENAFLLKIWEAIERNLDNSDFSTNELCRTLGMSRTQVHQKITALTNRSTSLYIRSIRLHKAKELLQTTDLSISEIAYDVGFKSLQYFTRCFTSTFHKTPSQFRNEFLSN